MNTDIKVNVRDLENLFSYANDYILSSPESDVSCLSDLLKAYNGSDWKHYIGNPEPNSCCKYKKVLVHSNDMLDLYIITWPPKVESCIHDHPNHGCLVRILQGELCEDEYLNDNEVIKYVGTNELKCSNVNFGFKIGNRLLHKIKNPTDEITVSVHLYSRGGYKMKIYK